MAVFTGVVPGTYDLVVAEQTNRMCSRGTYQASIVVPCSLEAREGQVSSPLKVAFQPANSTVRFGVETVYEGAAAFPPPRSFLFLHGPRAHARLYLNSLHSNSAPDQQEAWVIKGTPPGEFSTKAQNAEGFTVTGLPAGPYELHAFRHPPEWNREGPPPDPYRSSVLVKTFDLKDVETLDLGTLRIEFPRADPANKEPREAPDMDPPDEIGDDEPLQ